MPLRQLTKRPHARSGHEPARAVERAAGKLLPAPLAGSETPGIPDAAPEELEPPSGQVAHLPPAERVERLLQVARGHRRALILTHDNPDPDAIASAMALAHLLHKKAGVQARIAYGGIVGRAENVAMLRVLRVPLTPASRIDFNDFDLIGLVDTQPSVGNHSLPQGRTADIVIDHHPPREQSFQARFADVGRGYGATCSVLVEYLRAAGVDLPRDVATALFYGIKSDTRDLGRQTHRIDVDSYLYLFPQVDKQALAQIEHPELPARYFQLYNQAIEKARVFTGTVFVDLGQVYSPDMVAEVGERLLALEGMKWSLAWGTYANHLFVSIRTTDRRVNAGRLIREICEDLGGSAGGHGSMAGARIPLHGTRAQRERFKRQLLRRFLLELGQDEGKGRPLLRMGRQGRP